MEICCKISPIVKSNEKIRVCGEKILGMYGKDFCGKNKAVQIEIKSNSNTTNLIVDGNELIKAIQHCMELYGHLINIRRRIDNVHFL